VHLARSSAEIIIVVNLEKAAKPGAPRKKKKLGTAAAKASPLSHII
jgi:hypothetical protein